MLPCGRGRDPGVGRVLGLSPGTRLRNRAGTLLEAAPLKSVSSSTYVAHLTGFLFIAPTSSPPAGGILPINFFSKIAIT